MSCAEGPWLACAARWRHAAGVPGHRGHRRRAVSGCGTCKDTNEAGTLRLNHRRLPLRVYGAAIAAAVGKLMQLIA